MKTISLPSLLPSKWCSLLHFIDVQVHGVVTVIFNLINGLFDPVLIPKTTFFFFTYLP